MSWNVVIRMKTGPSPQLSSRRHIHSWLDRELNKYLVRISNIRCKHRLLTEPVSFLSHRISLEIIFWNHTIIFDGLVSNQLYNETLFAIQQPKYSYRLASYLAKSHVNSFYIASQMLWYNIVCKYKSRLSYLYLDQSVLPKVEHLKPY